MRKKKYTGLSTATLDKLWASRVKSIARNKCEICGDTKGLNSHHIQPRNNYSVRWYLRNGVCLCNKCHQKDPYSAHKNPLWFMEYMIRWRGELWFKNLIKKTAEQTDWKSRLQEIKDELS